MNYLLAPHSDDESLFAAYTLLRHHPLVFICFNGRRRKHYVPEEVREAETAAAMEVLGCEFKHLHVRSDPPDWVYLSELLVSLAEPDHVWAPLPEHDGHSHHNGVGHMALELWPGRVTLYATYTMHGGKSMLGTPVPPEDGWEDLKRKALTCYESQLAREGTRPHFERALDEYEVTHECEPQHTKGQGT